MPTMTPSGHPQEIRPAAAAIPKAITKSTATGVAMVMTEVTRLVAPVAKGDAAWARASSGVTTATIKHSTVKAARALSINIVRFIRASPRDSLVAVCRESRGRAPCDGARRVDHAMGASPPCALSAEQWVFPSKALTNAEAL